jgi:uncharacterized membrane protein
MDQIKDSSDRRTSDKLQPFSMVESALELLALGGMLVCVLIVALNYSSLPARIPMHFTTAGVADRYGHKGELWLLAGIVVLLCLVNWGIARFIHKLPDTPLGSSLNSPVQLLLARKLVLLLNVELALLFVIAMQQAVRLGRGTAQRLDNSGVVVMLILMGLTVVAYLIGAVRQALNERASQES